MSSRQMLPGTLLACALFHPLLAPAQAPATAGQPVDIALRPQARADGPIIRVGHVAQVSGGDVKVREAIAGLDLAELRNPKASVALTDAEVKYRLLLAGHAPQSFRLTGAPKCVVRQSRGAVTEATILKAARAAVLARIPQFADHVIVKPACPVTPPTLDCQPRDRVVLDAVLADAKLPLGRTSVAVTVVVNGQKRAVVAVDLEVLPAPPTSALASAAAARPPVDESPVIVRSRERVKLVARMGAIQILAAGDAQQDGRLGQSIRVRNIDSSKIVQGRVLGPGMVQVEY